MDKNILKTSGKLFIVLIGHAVLLFGLLYALYIYMSAFPWVGWYESSGMQFLAIPLISMPALIISTFIMVIFSNFFSAIGRTIPWFAFCFLLLPTVTNLSDGGTWFGFIVSVILIIMALIFAITDVIKNVRSKNDKISGEHKFFIRNCVKKIGMSDNAIQYLEKNAVLFIKSIVYVGLFLVLSGALLGFMIIYFVADYESLYSPLTIIGGIIFFSLVISSILTALFSRVFNFFIRLFPSGFILIAILYPYLFPTESNTFPIEIFISIVMVFFIIMFLGFKDISKIIKSRRRAE